MSITTTDILQSNPPVVRLPIEPANRTWLDERPQPILCFSDMANDHIFGGNMQLLCRPMVTFCPNVRARGVCWIHSSFY